MTKHVGILTAGGDCPGLNAAIRAIGKGAMNTDMRVIGFDDGFRGLMENRTVPLEGESMIGLLTLGGTILGTSRDKPHKMPVDGTLVDIRRCRIFEFFLKLYPVRLRKEKRRCISSRP